MGRRDTLTSEINCAPTEQLQSPLEKRSCTDVICLLLFVAFLGVWGFVGSYAYSNHKLANLTIPIDSNGQRCGVDAPVKTKPYVINFDMSKCLTERISVYGCATEKVCVEQCPKSHFLNGVINTCTNENFEATKANLICLNDKAGIKDCNDIKEQIKQRTCSPLTVKSKNVFNRCIPDPAEIGEILANLTGDKKMTNNTVAEKVEDVSAAIYADVIESQKLIAWGIVSSVVASIVFIAVLRWLVKPVVWGSLIGCGAVLAYCLVFSWTKYTTLEDTPTNERTDYTAVLTADDLLKTIAKPLQSKNFWLYVSIGLSIVTGIVFLIFLVLRSRISLAIALVKEGSKAVSSTVSAVFFPLIPWALSTVVLLASGWLWLALSSISEDDMRLKHFQDCSCLNTSTHSYYENASCSVEAFQVDCQTNTSCPTAKCESVGVVQPDIIIVYKIITLFGAYWGSCFVMAFGEMVLASTFATWYWTMDKSQVPNFNLLLAMCRTIRYHLGTIAFGSLLLAICKLARDILSYVEKKAKIYDNFATRTILCLLKGLFWCLEKFLKFFNTNVYIVTAINGTGFCSSAKDAFGLLTRNALRSLALTNVTGFLFFLSKLFISLGMGSTIYQYTIVHEMDYAYLNYSFVPASIVTVVTYVICSVFFSVYGMAVDTIFLCFLIDCEKNDGSPEKRYFMSKSLMSILGKKYRKRNLSRQSSIISRKSVRD